MAVRAQVAVGDTAQAQQRYDLATTEFEAVAAREDLVGTVGRIRSSRRATGAFLAGVGVVYTVSVLDALVRHVRRPSLSHRIDRASYGVRVSPSGASLAIRF